MATPELLPTEEMGERPRTNDVRGRGRSNEEIPDLETRREREPRGARSDRSSNGADRGERRSRRDRGSSREREKEEWHDYLKDEEEAAPTAMALALQAAMVQDAEQDSRRQKRLEKDRDRRRQDDFRTEQEDIVARTLRLRQTA